MNAASNRRPAHGTREAVEGGMAAVALKATLGEPILDFPAVRTFHFHPPMVLSHSLVAHPSELMTEGIHIARVLPHDRHDACPAVAEV